MDRKTQRSDMVLAAVLLATVIVSLSVFAPFRIGFKEQLGLFSWDPGRLSMYLSDPAVLASIAGDWLSTYFFHNATGIIISALLLGLLAVGLMRIARVSGLNPSWALIAVVVLMEESFLTYPNYPLSRTVSLLLAVWVAYAVKHIQGDGLRKAVVAVMIPVMFVAAGGHALTFALLCCLAERKGRPGMIICAVIGITAMLVMGRFYNLPFVQILVFPIVPLNIIPGRLLLLIQFVCVLLVSCIGRIWYDGALKTIVLSVLIVFIGMSLACDKEQEYTIRIGTNAYKGNWDKVLEDGEKNLNQYGLYYRNLYYARAGRLPDNLLTVDQNRRSDGLFLTIGQNDSFLSSFYFTDALLEMGNLSEAIDCALLGQTVVADGYSTRMLRRLAEISVSARDYGVARKYLKLLETTRNHRSWARNLLTCIDKDSIPEQYMLWRGRASGRDRLYDQGDTRAALKNIADDSPMNIIAIDYLLCSYLLEKNVNTFISMYDRYYLDRLDRIVSVPNLYQEALLVNVDSDASLWAAVDKYHLSDAVVRRFMSLMEFRASGGSEVLPPEYSRTYWGYIMSVKLTHSQNR
ncbi:MAG: hypothetical protein J6P66_11160 [Bacteroidaceae bacterium]|nr:hypothetical protein [Bacteroidaceae bacterium]